MANNERWVNNRMFIANVGVAAGECARTISEGITFNQQVGPVEDVLLHHSGDMVTFVFAEVLYNFLRVADTTRKKAITLGVNATILFAAEDSKVNHLLTSRLNFPILGTPDLKDIPVGAAGLILWLAFRNYLEMVAPRESRTVDKKSKRK